MEGKQDNNRRRPFAGLALMLLYFSKKEILNNYWSYFSSNWFYCWVLFWVYCSNRSISRKDESGYFYSYPVNSIDPFLSEKILFGIGILGIGIVGLGIASRKRDKNNLVKLK